MKYLKVTMPDGSKWVVPARIIAHNRARYYNSQEPGCYDDEFDFTMGDSYELRDWAGNNMDWKDVKVAAVQIKTPESCDYQDGWVKGAKEVVELNLKPILPVLWDGAKE